MTNPKLNPLVRVVDDEESVRDSRRFVLTLAGFEVACYSNGDDFLARDDFRRPGCLILDLQMPGMSGLEVQSELLRRNTDLPVIFVTGHGEVNTAVIALKRGAFDFLEKPVEPSELQRCVEKLTKYHLEKCTKDIERRKLRERFNTLSPREKEVASEIAAGQINKVIGARLGLAEQTIKIHRSNIFKKLDVRSPVELSKILQTLEHEITNDNDGLTRLTMLSEA